MAPTATWYIALLLAPLLACAKFSVTDDEFSTDGTTVKMKVIKNSDTGEEAAVNVNFGGGVESLTLRSRRHGAVRSVLWTHERNATAVALNTDWRGKMLIPYGNRIGGAKYIFNGTEHHLPVNDVMPCDPPLVCVNNSLHGLLWNRSMEVVNDSVQEGQASVTLRYDFPGTDPGYPFKLRTEITYTLVTQTGRGGFYGSQFIVSVAFTNLDHAGWPLPVYNGWHPYILCHTSASIITLDPCTDWAHVDVGTGKEYPPPRFSNMVPTGHVSPSTLNGSQPIGGTAAVPTYHDDEYKALQPSNKACGLNNLGSKQLNGGGRFRTKLTDPVTDYVTILSHESHYLQVWTGALATFGVDAVVLEPLSSMSDAFNNHNGLHILDSGETYTNEFSLEIE